MGGNFRVVLLLGILAIVLVAAESANILCLYTSHSPSHLIIHMSYVKALVQRGHNVTVVTTLPLNGQIHSFHHIYIPQTEFRLQEMATMKSQVTKQKRTIKSLRAQLKLIMSFGALQYEAIKDKRFQDFLHNPGNKFDLMLMGFFFSDFLLGVGMHFKCPVVISWMSASNLYVDRYIGNPPEIAYTPASPIVGIPDPLTFIGRLTNFFVTITSKIFTAIVDSQMTGFYNDLFPAPSYPSMKEAGKKVSLLLCNSHFSEGIIRPNVPAAIEVGGIQIKESPDPLPKELQEIFDASSEHGVIYISFGSHLGSYDFEGKFYQIIYKAVSGLKQTVLWKWDSLKKPGNSSNIRYQKWLPQDDLLPHPNLKLFITHAGKGSVAEAQYHGVPMVAIPVFGDQPRNAGLLSKAGFGLQLDRNTMTSETLRAAIIEVIENPKYKENIKRFSKLYSDRPMKARETAVYWIEYVIRHKGAYHMQSPLVYMSFLQYFNADVIAYLLLVAYSLYRLVKIPIKFVLRAYANKFSLKKTQ